jgi:hypothetical protein
MTNLFVITASNPEARQHVADTIEHRIRADKVERHFAGDELAEVKKIGIKHGYYAWGAAPGPRNRSTWAKMQIGDHVLVYQNRSYTYYTTVLFKAHNREFALDNWGQDDAGRTWEYIYLLDRPTRFTAPVEVSVLAHYLPLAYLGFTRVSDERTSRITSAHGSLEAYLAQVFPDLEAHRFSMGGGDQVKSTQSVQILDLIVRKKQIILYGPPGTGKTHKTRSLALGLLGE